MKDVRDLLDSPNYNFVTYTAFITKYNIQTNYVEYYKAVSALIKTGKMFLQSKPHSLGKSSAENLQFATKIISSFSKERLHLHCKARKSGFLRIFFQMYK